MSNIILVCGRVNQELINNGQKSFYGNSPWTVGVYQLTNENSTYDFICGGSIISSNLVVSGKIFIKQI